MLPFSSSLTKCFSAVCFTTEKCMVPRNIPFKCSFYLKCLCFFPFDPLASIIYIVQTADDILNGTPYPFSVYCLPSSLGVI